MGGFDITAASGILKAYYTSKRVETLIFESPALALMPKRTDGAGNALVGSIRTAIANTISADDTVAFGAGSGSSVSQWTVPWRYGYGAANVSGEVIDKTANDRGAFVRALTFETESAFKGIGQHLGAALWGNGGGAIGQIAATSNVATTAITLTDPNQIVNFWKGQVLQAATTDGTSGSVEAGTVTVTAVDMVTGVITASGNWSTGISTIANGDYLFLKGDFGAKMIGIPGWLPNSANRPASNDSFCGVNRFADPMRLAGNYYSKPGAPKEQSLIQLGTRVQRAGGRPKHLFVNPTDYADLIVGLGTQVRYTTDKSFGTAQIGFDAIEYATPFGTIKIVQDPFVPTGFGYLLDLSTFELVSMGSLPQVKLADGLNWLRASGADSYQMRTLYRAALYCSKPSSNGVVSW